ncbi:MAG TPA: TIGR03086 family metal-binding protein [Acidimicrobiales bacterium]|nr:TIGR03086 family metal-binding protein [Acidimicrobiales bacterium]
MSDPTRLAVAAIGGLDGVVLSVRPDDVVRSTPCADWRVAELLDHVVDELRWAPPLLAGRSLDQAAAEVAAASPASPERAWGAAAARAVDAIRRTSTQRVVATSAGPAPAGHYLTEVFADLLVHRWDLAVAIGVDDQLPTGLVATALDWFAASADEWRAAGALAAAVPVAPDADPQTRLLAELGRDRRAWLLRRSPDAASPRPSARPAA